ncbi:importin alpha [Anaeramoeba ignava]|uniref:Vacuolar protein 8 n=1 Tax=Anaeramoeba ignava TaxID=1746090 RepID=A0A9Q0L8I3_ANAIG|nr:importin alpha [Anaeramoeba ignava]
MGNCCNTSLNREVTRALILDDSDKEEPHNIDEQEFDNIDLLTTNENITDQLKNEIRDDPTNFEKIIPLIHNSLISDLKTNQKTSVDFIYKNWGNSEMEIPRSISSQFYSSLIVLLGSNASKIQHKTLQIIGNLTSNFNKEKSKAACDFLIQHKLLPALVKLSQSPTHDVQRGIVSILVNISTFEENHLILMEHMIPSLLNFFHSGSHRVQRNSLIILHQITKTNSKNPKYPLEIIDNLLQMLGDRDTSVQYYTLANIAILSEIEEIQNKIIENQKAISGLVSLAGEKTNLYLNEKNSNIFQILIIFKNISTNKIKGQNIVVNKGIVPILLNICETANFETQRAIVQTFSCLSKNNLQTTNEMIKLKVIDKMMEIMAKTGESMLIQDILIAISIFVEHEFVANLLNDGKLVSDIIRTLSPPEQNSRMTTSLTVSFGLQTSCFIALTSLISHKSSEKNRLTAIENNIMKIVEDKLNSFDLRIHSKILKFLTIITGKYYTKLLPNILPTILEIDLKDLKNERNILWSAKFCSVLALKNENLNVLLHKNILDGLSNIFASIYDYFQSDEAKSKRVTRDLEKDLKKIGNLQRKNVDFEKRGVSVSFPILSFEFIDEIDGITQTEEQNYKLITSDISSIFLSCSETSTNKSLEKVWKWISDQNQISILTKGLNLGFFPNVQFNCANAILNISSNSQLNPIIFEIAGVSLISLAQYSKNESLVEIINSIILNLNLTHKNEIQNLVKQIRENSDLLTDISNQK